MNFLSADVEIKVDDSKVKPGLAKVRRAVEQTVDKIKKSFRSMGDAFGAVWTKMARTAKWALIAVVGAITASIKAFATFEKGMANVATMLDDQYRYLLPKYASGLKNIAMEFGESTATLAEGLYNVLSASIAPKKALEVLRIATRAAAAGLTDTGTAAYAITGIMNAYGMSADKAGYVSDILFATVKKGQTNFAQLAPAIGKVTAISASAGVRFEEVGAALATITRGGISTAEAVTGLRAVLISLMGKEEGAIKLAKAHGIELSTTALRTKGLIGMVNSLAKLDAETIKNIFKETEARTALNVLIANQAGLMQDLDATVNASGSTQKAYQEQINTLSLAMKRMWQTIKVVGIEIGEQFAPYVRKAADDLAVWLKNNREKFKDWAAVIAKWLNVIKNAMVSWAKFLREDWTAAIKLALNVIVELFKGFGKTIVATLQYAITSVWNNMGTWILKSRHKKFLLPKLQEEMFEEMTGHPMTWTEIQNAGVPTPFAMGTSKEARASIQKMWNEAGEKARTKIGKMDIEGEFDKKFPMIEYDTSYPQRLIQIAKETSAGIEAVWAESHIDVSVKEQNNSIMENLNRLADASKKTWSTYLDWFKSSVGLTSKTATEQTNQAVNELTTRPTNIFKEMAGGFQESAKQMKLEMITFGEVGATVATHLRDGMASAFSSMIMNARNFSDLAQGFLGTILQSMVQIISMQMATGLISGMTGFLGGMFGASAAAPAAAAAVAHTGGTIGSTRFPTRKVPLDTFIGAPRLHKGLASDEFPAILQKGEKVIPKDGRSTGGGSVNITVTAIDSVDTYRFLNNNKRAIASMVQGAITTNHPLRKSV